MYSNEGKNHVHTCTYALKFTSLIARRSIYEHDVMREHSDVRLYY